MDHGVECIKQEILASGSDDWIHIAEIVAFAREALYGDHVQDGYPEDDHLSVEALAASRDEWLARHEREALPYGIRAIKELLRDELIHIGETVSGRFVAWSESAQERESRIDSVTRTAIYPLLPGDLFWVRNTPVGDQRAASGIDLE